MIDAVGFLKRRSVRLHGYDYACEGAYFVTIVAHQRKCLFGDVVKGEVRLSQAGKIAQEEWFKTAELRPYIELFEDEFIVMPNHIHGIIWVHEFDRSDPVEARVGAQRRCAPTSNPFRVPAGSLGAIVRGYKSAVTYAINKLYNERGLPIWQRNYYEHTLRGKRDYQSIYDYILSNPANWENDAENTSQP